MSPLLIFMLTGFGVALYSLMMTFLYLRAAKAFHMALEELILGNHKAGDWWHEEGERRAAFAKRFDPFKR